MIKPDIKIEYDNYRVEVEPDFYFNESHRNRMTTMENICGSIERHVDDVKHAAFACDTNEVCAYCKSRDFYNKTTGEPRCCDAAIAAWDAKVATEEA